jgi:hypothetical protein
VNTSWFDAGPYAPDPASSDVYTSESQPEPTHHSEYDYYAYGDLPRLPHGTRRVKSRAAALSSLIIGGAGMPLLWVLLALFINWYYETRVGFFELILGVALILILLLAGLALGIAAFRWAVIDPKRFAPRRAAIPGIIVSGVGLILFPVVSSIAIPAFLASRRASNEGAAIQKMKRIAAAQFIYRKSVGNGNCGDIEVMPGLTLLDLETAKTESNGYRFYVKSLPDPGCEIHGVPISTSEGDHSFVYSTTDNQLRSALNQGKPATPGDLLIGSPPRTQQAAVEPPSQ